MVCWSLYPFTEGFTLAPHAIPIHELNMLDQDHVFKSEAQWKEHMLWGEAYLGCITALPLTACDVGQPIT